SRPNDSIAMNNLAYALTETGDAKDLDSALQFAQRALQISPNEPDFRDTLGWIWLKKGTNDSALQVFTALCREAPANPSYRHHLGLALLATRNHAAARQAFETALASGPSRDEAAQIRQALQRTASN